MGNKPSGDVDPREKKISDEIDHTIYVDKENDNQLIKLLLLGAGESGKSTLFKQMIYLYGEGFSKRDKILYIPMIHSNTLLNMRELCRQSDLLDGCALSDSKAQAAKDALQDVDTENIVLNSQIAQHITTLWNDPQIRKTYDRRAEFQIVDSIDSFFNDIDRISAEDYVPTHMDLIKCRVRTTGIVENKFNINENRFLMVDVGGQRNERKKWIHCFEHVTAVIFVAAISAYDQTLYEDGKTNRLDEALALFRDTHKKQWFVRTSFILFLNKRDLFADKIRKVPLTKWQEARDFEGDPHDYHQCINFIESKFAEDYEEEKKLYVHVTCATDSNNVMAVFGAVKDIIIQKHLAESGLI